MRCVPHKLHCWSFHCVLSFTCSTKMLLTPSQNPLPKWEVFRVPRAASPPQIITLIFSFTLQIADIDAQDPVGWGGQSVVGPVWGSPEYWPHRSRAPTRPLSPNLHLLSRLWPTTIIVGHLPSALQTCPGPSPS